MSSIARILVTNSSRINHKRIINKFGSYLLARNVSSSTQPQIEKTVQELTKENGNLIAQLQQLKQDFEGRIAQLQKEKEEILKGYGKNLAKEDKQIMLKINEMKFQIPSESWYNLASQNGYHPFADQNENGDITLGSMEIPSRDEVPSDPPMVRFRYDQFAVDLPNLPMPENVRNFDEITLTYVDEPILDFLRKFQANSLLANVQLDLSYESKNHVLPILDEILPLISSIYAIKIYNLFRWIYDNDNDDKEHEPLLKTMVAQTKILAIEWYTHGSTKCTWEDKFDWCCSWLYSPREDGKPRALISDSTITIAIEEPHCSSFIDRIKKDFLEANNAVSFYIRLAVPRNFKPEIIFLENNKTNEKLIIKAVVSPGKETEKYGEQRLLISRHSSKVAKHKIEEEEKEISEWDSYNGPRRIHLTRECNWDPFPYCQCF